jgi:cysteinyl-tRNA synthetase
MVLKLYNTLARKKEVFKPIKKGEVGIYGCGPTVYWYQHIGNIYRYVFEDILVRTLLFNKYKVKHVINITDVGHLTSDADEGEDKMLKAIKREGMELSRDSMLKIAKKYTDAFNEDLKKVNIIQPDYWSKATEHIQEQIELIKRLEKNGYTYTTNVGLIFDTGKYKAYGKLANLKLKNLKAGSRVKVDNERKNKSDFALWVTNQPNHVMQWDSPWGKGFPGWHIECSAMSMKYLGEQFDIHTGGEEHIPVHHTNEIAQSECATGKKPWVRYWLHLRWLIINGGKMSKSLGNVYLLSELEEKGYKPLEFRYFCLGGHYRKNLNFTLENLDNAKNSYNRLQNITLELKDDKIINEGYLKEFESAINNDLDMPKALQVLWKLVRDEKAIGKYQTIKKMDEVFGLKLLEKEKIDIPDEVKKLAEERDNARKNKDWKKSDEMRDKIKKLGFVVNDTANGWEIKKEGA